MTGSVRSSGDQSRPLDLFRALVVVFCLFGLLGMASCGGGTRSSGTAGPASPPATGEAEAPACEGKGRSGTAGGERDVYVTLKEDGRFQTLVRILESEPVFGMAQESLLEVFQRPTWNHTVLAPTDEAWQAVPESTIESLVKNDDLAIEFFDAHLVEDLVGSESLADCGLRTVAGSVPVTAAGGEIMIGEASVLEADILASNGIVHAVDALIEEAPTSS